jgi:hypothetical protein
MEENSQARGGENPQAGEGGNPEMSFTAKLDAAMTAINKGESLPEVFSFNMRADLPKNLSPAMCTLFRRQEDLLRATMSITLAHLRQLRRRDEVAETATRMVSLSLIGETSTPGGNANAQVDGAAGGPATRRTLSPPPSKAVPNHPPTWDPMKHKIRDWLYSCEMYFDLVNASEETRARLTVSYLPTNLIPIFQQLKAAEATRGYVSGGAFKEKMTSLFRGQDPSAGARTRLFKSSQKRSVEEHVVYFMTTLAEIN